MISMAIESLNRENGSNKTRISKYIESRYGRLPAGHSKQLSHHLGKMTDSGELMFWKNNYYLNQHEEMSEDLDHPHPSYPEMIYMAIEALNSKNGSNKTTISKYIQSSFEQLSKRHSKLLFYHLNKMKERGELMFWKNNYYRNGPNAPLRRGRGRPPNESTPPLSPKIEQMDGSFSGHTPKEMEEDDAQYRMYLSNHMKC